MVKDTASAAAASVMGGDHEFKLIDAGTGKTKQALDFDGRKAIRKVPKHKVTAKELELNAAAMREAGENGRPGFNIDESKITEWTKAKAEKPPETELWKWFDKNIGKKVKKKYFKWKYGVEMDTFDKSVKGNTPLLKMMRMLNLSQREAMKFLKLFEKVDNDHSGTIDIDEFFGFFRMPITEFARASFRVMDFDQPEETFVPGRNGKPGKKVVAKPELTYAEFFTSLYNYCTLGNDTLVRFTFDVIDGDGSGEVSKAELYDMVRMMHTGQDAKEVQRKVQQLMNVLDANHDGDIAFDEFLRAHRKVGSLMYPAFQMQKALRARCMSHGFWTRAEKRREKIEVKGGASIIDLYRAVCAEKQEEDEDYAEADVEGAEAETSELDDDDLDHIDEMRARAMAGLQKDLDDRGYGTATKHEKAAKRWGKMKVVTKLVGGSALRQARDSYSGGRPGTREGGWWSEDATKWTRDGAFAPDGWMGGDSDAGFATAGAERDDGTVASAWETLSESYAGDSLASSSSVSANHRRPPSRGVYGVAAPRFEDDASTPDRPTTPGINLRVARKVVVSHETAAALSDAFAIREHALQKLREKRDAPPPPDPFAMAMPIVQDAEEEEEAEGGLTFAAMKAKAKAAAAAAAEKTAAAAKAGAAKAKAGAEAQAAKVQAKIDAEKALWEDAAHGDLEGLSAEELKARLAEEKAAQQLADLEAAEARGDSILVATGPAKKKKKQKERPVEEETEYETMLREKREAREREAAAGGGADDDGGSVVSELTVDGTDGGKGKKKGKGGKAKSAAKEAKEAKEYEKKRKREEAAAAAADAKAKALEKKAAADEEKTTAAKTGSDKKPKKKSKKVAAADDTDE